MTIKDRKTWRKRLCYIIFIIVILLYIAPLIITFTNSFMSSSEVEKNYTAGGLSENEYINMKVIPERVTLSQYKELLFHSPVYLNMFWNSVKICLPIVFGQIVVSALAAYAFTVMKFKCKEMLFFLYIIVMLLPLQVTLMPNYIVADWLNLQNSYLAIILPGIFSPFGVFLLRQFMKSIPDAYIEAARIDGAGHGRIFLSIILPMIKPGIAAATMLISLEYWNLIDQAVVFIQNADAQPLSTFLAQINHGEVRLSFAGSCFYAVPMVLILLYGQDYLKNGISITGLKG